MTEMPNFKFPKAITVTELKKILAGIEEGNRLRSLSNCELVAEVLNTNHADSLLVNEMMTRLDPFWSSRADS